LQLLADRLVELEIVDSISIKTAERTLKKTRSSHIPKSSGYPPGENGNFVAVMENVLEIYQRPHDPVRPVICMDEQPIQLHAEVREPIPAQPGYPERQGYEFRRNGVVGGFMFTEPLGQ
jgi:hypothetical protein